MKTLKDYRKQLKEMENYSTITVGKIVIMKTVTGFAIRNIDDEDDIMHDYSAYVYDFKLKYVLENIQRELESLEV